MKRVEVLEFETAGGVTIHSSRWKNGLVGAGLAAFTGLAALSVWSFLHYPTGKDDIWYELGLGLLTAYALALTVQIATRAVSPESLHIARSGLSHHWLFGVRRWGWSEIETPRIVRAGFRGLFINVRFDEVTPSGRRKTISLPLYWEENPERIAGMIETAREQAAAGAGGFTETVHASGDLRMKRYDPITVRRFAFAAAAILLIGYYVALWLNSHHR